MPLGPQVDPPTLVIVPGAATPSTPTIGLSERLGYDAEAVESSSEDELEIVEEEVEEVPSDLVMADDAEHRVPLTHFIPHAPPNPPPRDPPARLTTGSVLGNP